MMVSGIVFIIVDTQNDCNIFPLCGCRNDHFLCSAPSYVILCTFDLFSLRIDAILFLFKQTGTFVNYLNSQIRPRQIPRIVLAKNFYWFAIDYQLILAHLHRTVKSTVIRVILQQVRHRFQITNIIKSDDFKFIRMVITYCFQNLSPHPSKSINSYFYSHAKPPLKIKISKSILHEAT